MLKIKNLTKHFGGIKAVDSCDFEIKPNKITALIGPNGAGKSTVFNIIFALVKEDSGQIIFDGKNIAHLSPDQISNLGISRLFQQSRLFNNLTVGENLFLALDNEDEKFWKNLFGFNKTSADKEKIVEEMLELVEMKKFKNTTARNLSYGQKRLVELGRTILNPHKLLILDEPVAGVNPRLRKKIGEILLELKRKGETVLFIEHDMNFTLKIADEVIVMEKGRVIARGQPEEIRNNPQVLEAYLGE
jgi:ABC-type branched-subunit amino acid transport system ATPase component